MADPLDTERIKRCVVWIISRFHLSNFSRKLRKKLRQIENLEVLDRELNDEELDKVLRKGELRKQLVALVRETEEEMKRQHEEEGTDGGEGSPRKQPHVERQGDLVDQDEGPIDERPIEQFSEREVEVELHHEDSGESASVCAGLSESGCDSPTEGGWEVVTRPPTEPLHTVQELTTQGSVLSQDPVQPPAPPHTKVQAPRPAQAKVPQPKKSSQSSTSQAQPQPSTSQARSASSRPPRDPAIDLVREEVWSLYRQIFFDWSCENE